MGITAGWPWVPEHPLRTVMMVAYGGQTLLH